MARDGELPTKLRDEDELEEAVKALIDEAEQYVDKVIRPRRESNWSVYHGKVQAVADMGGCDLVAYSARDTVATVVPDLLEIMAGSDTIVSYVPSHSGQGKICQEASLAARLVFENSGGFETLHDSMMDAAVGGDGWVKIWQKKRVVEETETIPVMSEIDRIALESDENSTVNYGEEGVTADVTRPVTKTKLMLEAVPASDMLYTDDSCLHTVWLIGQRSEVRLGDLVEAGYPPDQLREIGLDEDSNQRSERRARNNTGSYDNISESNKGHWTFKKVTFYQIYPKLDIDGDGLAKRYFVAVAGKSKKILAIRPVEDHPYAQIPWYRIPHGLLTEGVVDRVKDLQEADTEILRAIVDNAQGVNSPMVLAPKNGVNHEKLSKWKKHKIIDANIPDSVKWFVPPSAGQDLVNVRQVLQETREERTGIDRVSQGLHPETLQSTSEIAIAGSMGAAQRKLEFVVRVVAEFGVKTIFKKLLREMIAMGQFTVPNPIGVPMAVDAQNFDPAWSIRVKVGLGTGNRHERLQMLMQALTFSKEIIAQYGPVNAVTSIPKTVRLVHDIGHMFPGLNFYDYYNSPEEAEQMMAQQGAQPQQQDPRMIEAQAKVKDIEEKRQKGFQEADQRMGIKQQDQQLKSKDQFEKQRNADQKAALDHKIDMGELQLKREDNQSKIRTRETELMIETALEEKMIKEKARQGNGTVATTRN